ncbi:MAG: hypothetical protein EAZ06_05400 [Cytophagales bacterium]|nr:MAG: hypothetical protein EAZ06_05400 [Cytophagales bacterium]
MNDLKINLVYEYTLYSGLDKRYDQKNYKKNYKIGNMVIYQFNKEKKNIPFFYGGNEIIIKLNDQIITSGLFRTDHNKTMELFISITNNKISLKIIEKEKYIKILHNFIMKCFRLFEGGSAILIMLLSF